MKDDELDNLISDLYNDPMWGDLTHFEFNDIITSMLTEVEDELQYRIEGKNVYYMSDYRK